jgi:hypothetical protein
MNDPGESIMWEMKVGLGQTRFYWSQNFERFHSEELVAYSKGQTTVGALTHDNWFTMGVEEKESISVQLFPNPASELMNVLLDRANGAHIALFDLQGRMISSVTATGNKASLGVSILSDGIYIVKIITAEGAATRKVTISSKKHAAARLLRLFHYLSRKINSLQ